MLGADYVDLRWYACPGGKARQEDGFYCQIGPFQLIWNSCPEKTTGWARIPVREGDIVRIVSLDGASAWHDNTHGPSPGQMAVQAISDELARGRAVQAAFERGYAMARDRLRARVRDDWLYAPRCAGVGLESTVGDPQLTVYQAFDGDIYSLQQQNGAGPSIQALLPESDHAWPQSFSRLQEALRVDPGNSSLRARLRDANMALHRRENEELATVYADAFDGFQRFHKHQVTWSQEHLAWVFVTDGVYAGRSSLNLERQSFADFYQSLESFRCGGGLLEKRQVEQFPEFSQDNCLIVEISWH